MKQIQLQTLKITNFKGIRSLEVNFAEKETTISGDNATGKTTIFDAFTWLLFDKDSHGSKVFDIKTINQETGEVIPLIDHEVEGILNIDNRKITLRKCYRENWVKKRGTAEATLEGHETVCFFDGVKIAVGEYKRRISDIVDESLFKLTTDPSYFNRLDTADRRNVLIAMAGEITNEMIEAMRPDLAGIMALINGYKPDEIKNKLSYQKTIIKKEYDMIPGRIDEKTREIGEAEDWAEILAAILEKQGEIDSMHKRIEDINSTNNTYRSKLQGLHNAIADLDREEFKLTTEARNEINRKNAELNAIPTRLKSIIENLSRDFLRTENAIANTNRAIANRNIAISQNNILLDSLRNDWTYTDSTQFHLDPEALQCPTCGSEYQWDKADEIREKSIANFNQKKASEISRIETEAGIIKKQNETFAREIKEEEIELDRLNDERKRILQETTHHEKELRDHGTVKPLEYDYSQVTGLTELKQRRKEIEEGIQEMQNTQTAADTRTLQEERSAIQKELDQLNLRLGRRELIGEAEARLKELIQMQRDLGQQIADIEKQEFMVAEFFKTKLQEIEKTVNEHFTLVRFRLFEMQINGLEKPVCEPMVNGVSFDSLNSATKINAGVDIVNALSKHYLFKAPIFIDNRETVNELIPTDSQIINLKVTRDNQLIFN
jgi:exonuclease SbcC